MKQQEKKSLWKILKIVETIYTDIKYKIREIINKIMGNSLVSGRVVSEGGVSSGPPQGVMGVETNLGGDQISGKWVNTRTGQEVWAQRMIDDGNGALVVTDKGVIPMSEFTEFVQMGDEQLGESPSVTPQITDNSNLMSKEDLSLISQISTDPKKQYSLDTPIPKTFFTPTTVTTESPNHAMIDKLFTKFDGVKIKVEIDWGDFPKDKIETLTDIFDIPKSEISEYIVNKYFDNSSIAKEIEEMI